MELLDIEVADIKEIELRLPNGQPMIDGNTGLPCTITVYSPASNAAMELKREGQKRLSDRMNRRGMKGITAVSPEEMDEVEINRLVKMTAGVVGITVDGVDVNAADEKTVRKMYEHPKLGWLRDQVTEVIGDWESFLK